MSTTNNATFGRRGASKPIPAHSRGNGPNPKLDPANSREEPRNPLVTFFYRVSIWIPRDNAPGIPAIALVVLRQLAFFVAAIGMTSLVMFSPGRGLQHVLER